MTILREQTGSIRDAGNTEGREVLESVPHRADGGSAGRGPCPCHVSAGLSPCRGAADLCDFPFWKALVDAGVPRSRVCDMIIDVTLTYLKLHSRTRSRRSKGM